LIGSAWAGALLGDVAAHHLGRGIGPVTRWLRRRKLSGPLVPRAARELRNRGGLLLRSARFMHRGRTGTNGRPGVTGAPRRRRIGFAALAALLWSIYSVGIGMLGGLAFHDQPLLGVGLGIGIALAVGGSIEAVRSLRDRRRQRLNRRRSAATGVCPAPVRAG